MGRLFGIDGVRGIALTELSCETAMLIGRAFGAALYKTSGVRSRVVVGKDTRLSSDIIETSVTAGILSAGVDVLSAGVIPSSGVSFLVNDTGADGGVMISASKSSMEYNGIKLFSSSGGKLSDNIEEKIEELVTGDPEKLESSIKCGADAGRLIHDSDAADRYTAHLLSACENSFSGMKIAVDCANGAASEAAEKLFGKLGAKVYLLNCEPDGTNINLGCGTSELRGLTGFVKDNSCDLGIALDGDGDKCIAVDETGAVVDGDKLLAIFAGDMKERGILNDSSVVVTALTNLGFSLFAEGNGIKVITTKVGSRYITERMLAGGYSLGGEQSGLIIFGSYALWGDGLHTALELLSVMKRSGRRLSELSSVMERYPQVVVNVKISPEWKEKWKNLEVIEKAIEEKEAALGSDGRIIVRESGTEPFIRVMAEGRDFETASGIALEIAGIIKKTCPK